MPPSTRLVSRLILLGWVVFLSALAGGGGRAFAIEATYRYFRFDPRSLRDAPAIANSVQISEFQFRWQGRDVSTAGVVVTNPEGNSPAAEGPDKVLDSNTGTKWLDFNKGALVFTFPAPVTIDSYTFATANDAPERDPIEWRLEGSLDGSHWRRLDEVRDFAVTTERRTLQQWFHLPATGFVPGDPVSPLWHPEEILQWSPEKDPDAPFNRSTVPLANRIPAIAALKANAHARLNEGRVMPLMAFNSTPAASAQGSRTLRYLTPLFWQYMHAMTFWGASDRDTRTILVPSGHVVDAAHRNGVPVLGKVFFSFSSEPDRLARVRRFLVKSGNTFPVADKLIEVARYYGFDGWFINQETAGTTSTDSQNMRDFIKYLRARAPELEIMWYDAMVESGARSFQNALTSQNDGFMKEGTDLVAHTMFLNFWWGSFFGDSTKMDDSRQRALSLGLDPYDIYAGIDTEGGGYHTNVDWTSLFPEGQPHRLSLGIYRPEWTFNSTSNPTDFHTRDLRYWVGPNGDPSNTTTADAWKGIAHYIPEQSAIGTLPFVTNFNVGQGTRYAIAGTNLGDREWTNLSLQDLLPTYRWMVESAGTKLVPSLDLTDSYEGGASLRVSGNLSAPNVLRLYRTDLPVSAQTILRITHKRGVAGPSAMQVGVAFHDAPTTFTYRDVGNVPNQTWNTAAFPLGEHAGKRIVAINLRFANATSISDYTMRIGQLAIYNDSTTATPAPTDLVVDHQESVDADSLSLRLRWTHSTSPVHHYDVFARHPDGTRVWLGATPSNVYFVPAARRKGVEGAIAIQVEAVSPTFVRSTPAQVSASFPSRPSTQYRLTGTVIGTTGSYQNNGRTRNNVFDQNTATFFDGPTADNVWAGLDFGAGNERAITAIQYYPRSAWSGRMLGGVFQASDTADFSSNVVTLASLPLTPVEGVYSTIAVRDPRRFRYVRYLAPNGGFGNVAEVAFFGVPLPSAPGPVSGSMLDGTTTLAWSSVAYASGYEIKRATNPNGPFTIVAANHPSSKFSEAGLTKTATYYYVITALNQAGRSSESAPVPVKDGYLQWVAQQGWEIGSSKAEFAGDADGDGLPNAAEYAAPGSLALSTAGQTLAIHVEVRDDAKAGTTLLRTTDLQTWLPVTLTLAPDQTGVSPGFSRWRTDVPLGSPEEKQFYRLRISR